jgi:hypothetical protein
MVENCAEKEVVIVPPVGGGAPSTTASKSWKLIFEKGVVKVPVIGTVLPVKVSISVPKTSKEAVELVADVFSRLKGDSAGTLGVHSCPAAGGVSEQPAAPSIPGSRIVIVIEMFGAAANVIKSVTGVASGPVASGGFVIFWIVPDVPSKRVKPPCCVLAGLFIEKVLPVKAMLPKDISAVPVKFRTPVITSALPAAGMLTRAKKLNAKALLTINLLHIDS